MCYEKKVLIVTMWRGMVIKEKYKKVLTREERRGIMIKSLKTKVEATK
jgi:hypothetical protein